jgi:hypothetical protein
LLTILALALPPARTFAQTASLAGVVVVTPGGRPVVGAEILMPGLKRSTRSDSAGRFFMAAVPAGIHEVAVRSIGYEPATAKVVFRDSVAARIDIRLSSNATTLETIDVKGTMEKRWGERLLEFEQRRLAGVGVFLTYDKLQKNSLMSVPGLLTSFIPGVRVTRMGGSDVAISSRGARNCPLQVLMNRLNMYNGESVYFDVNSIQPGEILGIEYYNAFSTPSEFNLRPRGPFGGSRCGTLVLWMK